MSANIEHPTDGSTDSQIISAQVAETLVNRVDAAVEDRDDLNNRSEAIRRGLHLVLTEGGDRR